jgi:hypothetical protein
MSVHQALRTLVSRYGPGIIESGDLRATLDDFLEEGEATPGQINLLADAVRLGAYEQMLPMLSHGADPRTVVEAVGARLAANRGGDQQSASWACAALGFAVGQVPEELVLRYTTDPPTLEGAQRAAASPPQSESPQWRAEPTRVVGPPMQPPHHQPQSGPASQAPPSRSRVFVVALIAAGIILAMVAAGAWIASRDGGGADDAGSPTVTSTDETPRDDTAPTESSPTTEGTTPDDSEETSEPPTGNGPLNVPAAFVNQQCRSQILVVLASSGSPAEYESTLGDAVDTVPNAKYLRTDESCSSFNQEIDGNPIYAAYIGPFRSIEEACRERYDSRMVGAYVRTLAADRETQDICSCRDGLDQLPVLEPVENPSYDVQQRVADLQTLLIYAGYDLGNYDSGDFDTALQEVVRDFQRDNQLVADGRVDAQTWVTLLDACQ